MTYIRTVQLNSYLEDEAIRSGSFSLLPVNPSLPIIVSQPVKNLAQFTWVEGFRDGAPVYQKVEITDNTINMIVGTEFSLGLKIIDPSNVNDINDTSFVSYKWKKDGALLYDLNSLNNDTGVNSFYIDSGSSITELTGKYTCEVRNLYGTVESDPLTINVIDPIDHPKLYKNLILNGDGEGGLDGWEGSSDLITVPFLKGLSTCNFGSYRLGGFLTFDASYDGVTTESSQGVREFFFTINGHSNLFKNFFDKAWNSTNQTYRDNFRNIDLYGISQAITDDWERWLSTGFPSQIVPNEDYSYGMSNPQTSLAGFFPGPNWLDTYNKNQNVTGLISEFKSYTPTYFTRDKLKFEKFGGTQQSIMRQTVDLIDIADFVDGNVYGVKYATSQFFAYVGAGITDYKIRVQTTTGEKILNYYIGDTEDNYHHVIGDRTVRPGGRVLRYDGELFDVNARYSLLPGTDIEIVPVVDDTVTITLDYLDESNVVLKSETIDGPNAMDVWAIKEKVHFPLTLWGIFEYLKLPAPATPTGGETLGGSAEDEPENMITVFGRPYTTAQALKPFFDIARTKAVGMFQQSKPTSNVVPLPTNHITTQLLDINAKFLLRKYNFADYGGSYPVKYWYAANGGNEGTPNFLGKTNDRALNDYGAAAMFGVGKTLIIPYKTRSVRITVRFTHNSEIIKDTNPELKSWVSQELYTDENGQSTSISRRLSEYGYPRCGVTKMKFIVAPNDLGVSDQYASYFIPPPNATTLGRARVLAYAEGSNAYLTTENTTPNFSYIYPTPYELPNAPISSSVFTTATTEQEYLIWLAQQTNNTPVQPPPPPPTDIGDDIQEIEDEDYNDGDYSGLTGDEF